MKYSADLLPRMELWSHLAGGGWIEIYLRSFALHRQRCPTSQEVGGLKFFHGGNPFPGGCPTSQEVGGLKWSKGLHIVHNLMSHLAGGGWIEIFFRDPSMSYMARPTSQEVGGLK